MKGIALVFMALAVITALMGMAWGIQMAASQDHTLSPAHGHLNLLGWVSCAIYAFYYHLMPRAADSGLAKLHFALVLASLVVSIPGIAMAIRGQTEALAKGGSLIIVASMLVFGLIVLRSAKQPA
ncbi:hypothetical protein QEZ52_20560 [Aliisedimentitalea scapharcae]|uniref:Uncharacterized protein n=1 Tax=Aliisedimentitalea scapharcae TaxID=1524259 RepID=A0ABZ2XUG0_9RHOB|nr:hypothetical protein K3727_21295 [Rhodobacteraceae bacterium M382]